MVKEEKCFDKLVQLFKVVSMIKKTQLLAFKDAQESDAKSLIFGELMLKS